MYTYVCQDGRESLMPVPKKDATIAFGAVVERDKEFRFRNEIMRLGTPSIKLNLSARC